MQITQITPDYSVAPQIYPGDIAALREQGFRTIICNRPDDEEPGQPDWETIATAAEAEGLEAHHLPIGPDISVEAQKANFARIYADAPKPILAYCRTGNRSTLIHDAVNG